jgi:hypothetical protein
MAAMTAAIAIAGSGALSVDGCCGNRSDCNRLGVSRVRKCEAFSRLWSFYIC